MRSVTSGRECPARLAASARLIPAESCRLIEVCLNMWGCMSGRPFFLQKDLSQFRTEAGLMHSKPFLEEKKTAPSRPSHGLPRRARSFIPYVRKPSSIDIVSVSRNSSRSAAAVLPPSSMTKPLSSVIKCRLNLIWFSLKLISFQSSAHSSPIRQPLITSRVNST